MQVNQDSHIKKKYIPDFAIDWLYGKVQKQINKINKIGKAFLYFQPFENIYEKAEKAKQDLTQETFLKFVQGISTYLDQGKPKALLYTIARNLCINWHKKAGHTAWCDVDEKLSANNSNGKFHRNYRV